jgi:hypothetical protein
LESGASKKEKITSHLNDIIFLINKLIEEFLFSRDYRPFRVLGFKATHRFFESLILGIFTAGFTILRQFL